ncbi:EexN family lipoprotein [Ignatzschineria indica]|uniref:EexN family lipoprotein n=1 Tax=Ignatzschineria indica TaxID=472583 RepID=UPI002581C235|nr:EexN family lipoprotein [Ignatzschineria indica]
MGITYLDNLDEAEAVKKKCEVTQGSKNNQNCINAEKAISRIALKKMIGIE